MSLGLSSGYLPRERRMMRIGIIGGGLMGMALAYFLSKAEKQVTVLEQGTTLGGLNSSAQLETNLKIARFQHNILPNDRAIRLLCQELGLKDELVFYPARSGFIHGGNIHPMSTTWEFMTFSPLRLVDRVRLGKSIWEARRIHDWRVLDQISAKEWLTQIGGKNTFDQIWAPLLEAKFDYEYDDIPATYIWTWLNRMTAIRHGPQLKSTVGHFKQGHEAIIRAMADQVVARGGQIFTDMRVREIELSGGTLGRVRTHAGMMTFDILIAALPTPAFSQLILGAGENYLATLERAQYLGLVCPSLVLERPLSSYWTLNITDPSSPFSSIIEMPHPENPRYRIVYLPKYTAPENDWMGVPDDDIREAWLMRLRQIFPELKPEEIRHFVVSRSRYVEPVHLLNASNNLLRVQTPFAGLYLANTSQVYPGLPTSESAITHAQTVAQMVIEQSRQPLRTVA
jgi:protoporphyrinogen oxidase